MCSGESSDKHQIWHWRTKLNSWVLKFLLHKYESWNIFILLPEISCFKSCQTDWVCGKTPASFQRAASGWLLLHVWAQKWVRICETGHETVGLTAVPLSLLNILCKWCFHLAGLCRCFHSPKSTCAFNQLNVFLR